jgi:hypothetical protein
LFTIFLQQGKGQRLYSRLMPLVRADRDLETHCITMMLRVPERIYNFELCPKGPRELNLKRLRQIVTKYCIVKGPDVDQGAAIAELQSPLSVWGFGGLL